MVWLGRLGSAHLDRHVKVGPVHQLYSHSIVKNVNLRCTVAAQKLDRVLFNIIRAHIQLCKCLDRLPIRAHRLFGTFNRLPSRRRQVRRGRIVRVHTDIVNVPSLNLVGADGRPPQRPVDDAGERERDRLGDGGGGGEGVHGHGCDQLQERVVRVHGRAREVECGRDGCEGRVEHDGEGLGDVEYVHGEDARLAVVEFVQDGVFWISVCTYLRTQGR